MNKEQLSFYKSGYWDARVVAIGDLRRIATLRRGLREELLKLADELEEDERHEHWESIQEESPGITEEQYQAELDASMDQIRNDFFQKNGLIKLRLVKSFTEK